MGFLPGFDCSSVTTTRREPAVSLRPYQDEAVEAWNEHVQSCQAEGRPPIGTIVMATGAGKTIVGLELARRRGRTLWVCPRLELVHQTEAAARKILGKDADIGTLYGRTTSPNFGARHLFISTAQSLAARRKLELLLNNAFDSGPFQLIVVDEQHHFPSPRPKKDEHKKDRARWTVAILRVIERQTALGWHHPELLGLTATPSRSDDLSLAKLWGKSPVYRYSISQGIADGYLSPFIVDQIIIDSEVADLAKAAHAGDQEADEIIEKCCGEIASITATKVKHEGRRGVVFVPAIKSSIRVAKHLQNMGVRAEHISCQTPKKERRALLDRHKAGELDILVCPLLLSEGYDDPGIDLVVMARPIRSDASHIYIQAAGRGLRPAPGKENCLILDLVNAHSIAGLVTASYLYDVEDRQAITRDRKAMEHQGSRNFELEQAKKILAGGDPSAYKMPWLCVVPGRLFALTGGANAMVIVGQMPRNKHTARLYEEGRNWFTGVVPTFSPYDNFSSIPYSLIDQKTECLTQEDATGVAITLARAMAPPSWLAKNARWRQEPATEGQLKLVKYLSKKTTGKAVPASVLRAMTKGEASDRISEGILRKFLRIYDWEDGNGRAACGGGSENDES